MNRMNYVWGGMKSQKPMRCSDRMCGADDCPNCHPENKPTNDSFYCRECGDQTVNATEICGICEDNLSGLKG
jgi:hypothetical protein